MAYPFAISQVADILGTNAWRIHKLLGRFEIDSPKGGKSKGRRLQFDLQNICAVGFSLWLFRAGLRASEIASVLKGDSVTACLGRLSTLKRLHAEAQKGQCLVISPVPGLKKSVTLQSPNQLQELLGRQTFVVVPIGTLLKEVGKRLEAYSI
jgi:hypothetical protein